jgi:hypothetical protein
MIQVFSLVCGMAAAITGLAVNGATSAEAYQLAILGYIAAFITYDKEDK